MTATRTTAPEELLRRHRFSDPIYVARPSMPSLDAYRDKLEGVWQSAWLTNNGALQQELETRLCEHLGVEHLSLCCNGTVALLLALQACGIDGGEVITTPFTFPATPHALYWNRVTPVFSDIDPQYFNLDAAGVEARIGPKTRAILPVHVFGYPCDVEGLQAVADRHGIPIIYDAAHVMGVRYRDRSVLEWGDASVLSFHATKLFTTGEGGAIVSRSREMQEQVGVLRNFGIADEETVIGPGINGKMSELQAALGLLQLDALDAEIQRRATLTDIYRRRLGEVPGLTFREDSPDVTHNYAYFTVLVEPEVFGMDRDRLHDLLREFRVHARKYFYPLCSHYPPYDSLPSARPEELPVAERVSRQILCLPLYGTLAPESVEAICAILSELHAVAC